LTHFLLSGGGLAKEGELVSFPCEWIHKGREPRISKSTKQPVHRIMLFWHTWEKGGYNPMAKNIVLTPWNTTLTMESSREAGLLRMSWEEYNPYNFLSSSIYKNDCELLASLSKAMRM